MKAWVLHGIGDVRYEDISCPRPRAVEVLVKVAAAGICGSDIPRIYTTGAHRHPLIPGHEFSGVVSETGSEVKNDWKGKRVGVFPLIPCRVCGPCAAKHYELCRNYDYVGSRCDGSFAEYVCVPEANLIELPSNVSFEQAAMLEPMSVAVHAMRRIRMDGSDGIAVCGLGTIGMLLVMFLLEEGYHNLYLIGNKESQKERVRKLGVPEERYCDSKKQSVSDWLLERTAGKGAEVFFECVGSNETYSYALDSVCPLGKVMLIGNPREDMQLSQTTYWKILRNQLQIQGTWNSSFCGKEDDDWHYVLNRLAQGVIRPEQFITHRFSLENLRKGLEIMRDKTEESCKIMIMQDSVQLSYT